MIAILKDFYERIASRKTFWIPLLLLSFGAYGFSMLNRTLCADDLATDLYVNSTIWLAELRWGAVLWKRLLSFGDAVPFLDKYLSLLFLTAAATVLACIFYTLRGRKGNAATYAAAACVFATFPILQEIWEFTCGGTLIVPGDFLLTFLVLLFLLTHNRLTPAGVLVPSLVMSLVCSSAESLAPCYVAAVMMILYYKYCVRRVQDETAPDPADPANPADPADPADPVRCAPGGRFAWIVDGLHYALILVLAMIIRVIIGYTIMKVMGLTFTHTGDTAIMWPLTGEQLRLLIGEFLTHYAAAALVYLPIASFVLFALLFILYSVCMCARGKSPLPILIALLIFISLFFLMLIQGQVMWYRTAITLMLFASFTAFLIMEYLETRPAAVYAAASVLLLFLCWRQAAYTHMLLALDNQRSENEAAMVYQIGHDIVSQYDAQPVVFEGDHSMSHDLWLRTSVSGDSLRERLFYRIRRKLTGQDSTFYYVQSNVTSTIDWYQREFDGKLMDAYFAYYGFDLDVLEDLSEQEVEYYTQKAREMGMKPYQTKDMGEYVLVCLGKLE